MPPRQLGLLTMATMLSNRIQTPVQLGLDVIQRSFAADLAIHNRITADMMSTFAVNTTDRRRRYGVSGELEFLAADEFTRSHTQRVVTGSEVEFPMNGYQAAIGWTAMFFKNKTVADMAATQVAAKVGHVKSIRRELQRALFGATNYSTYDYRVDNIQLDIKRFVNADGAPIPMGPFGASFNASTHTHYLWSNGLTNTSAHALVDTVVEHYEDGAPRVYINSADETAWRALTDFKEFLDARLDVGTGVTTPRQRVNVNRTNDREIGLFGPAIVHVKPWAISDYSVCLDTAAPKPLVVRTRDGNGPQLNTIATNVLFPLQADYMETEFGVGVWNRTSGAVLYHAAGASAYVDPTLP
jgi:hypothetical protein